MLDDNMGIVLWIERENSCGIYIRFGERFLYFDFIIEGVRGKNVY